MIGCLLLLFSLKGVCMKILLIADVHNRPLNSKTAHSKTLHSLRKVISETSCDLIVFLGDLVHGPDFKQSNESYEKYLRQVFDLTCGKKFAFVFGNHDDECDITKEEILKIAKSYSNCVTDDKNCVVKMMNEILLFVDSGSYYNGKDSYYDVVGSDTTQWIVEQLKKENKKAILFQHIIVADIFDCLDKYNHFVPFAIHGNGEWIGFKKGIKHKGLMLERPCPPDFNNGYFEKISPYIKTAVFGHDHINDFELMLNGVKVIQCGGCGSNCYDKFYPCTVKILDTETLETKKKYIL